MTQLSSTEQALLPTDEDVAFYRAHGWWTTPICLDGELIDDLAFALERYYAGERDRELPHDPGTDWTAAGGLALRQNDYLSMQMDEYYDFVRRPLLPAMAAILSSSREIRLFHDQIVYKPPCEDWQQTVVGWHCDRAYWQTCSSTSMLTAWIPFTDVDEVNGTMMVVDGSHRFPHNDTLHTFGERDLDRLEAKIDSAGQPMRKESLRLKKGQVSFHHCLTIHGSDANRTSTPRVALAIHYQDDSNHYRRFARADGQLAAHVNDTFCRPDASGAPDYTDPYICPLLWSGQQSPL